MEHLGENTVIEFLDGALSPEAAGALEAHAADCDTCRKLLSELARTSSLALSRLSRTAPSPTPSAGPEGNVETTLRREAIPGRGDEPLALAKGTVLGRYVILHAVGAGGMGVVHAAYDPELERKVALKLLRPDAAAGAPAEVRARLVREAQAMARLAHPNVVAVHDVGTLGDQVYVAMEFVEGMTLAAWMHGEDHGWRQVTDMFLGAGRGLAAAHAAGMVHRDFKPENVLIGKDGRPRVTDFGLVRLAAPREPLSGPLPLPQSGEVAPGGLTLTGAFMGTPAYMSPEQFAGKEADARSDQFGFCVALWEALHGERPFEGLTAFALAHHVSLGHVKKPTRGDAPAWLQKIVERGLAPDPADRHPSMDALLRAIEGGIERPRERKIAGLAAAAVLMAGLAAWGFSRRAPSELCKGAPRKLAGTWDAERQQQIRAAFLKTGAPFAEDAWESARRALDAQARAFVDMHTEACEATRVRGEQTDAVLGLRMACLDRRLGEMQALVGVYGEADRQTVEKAAQAAGALTPVSACANVEALQAKVRLPEDPAVREKVELVRKDLDRAKALGEAGKNVAASALAKQAVEAARPLGHAPTLADALLIYGESISDTDPRTGEGVLREAIYAAEAGRHDEAAARASLALARETGQLQSHFAEGREWARHAKAAIERLGGDKMLEVKLYAVVGLLDTEEGHLADARMNATRGLALAEKTLGPEDRRVAGSLVNLARVLMAEDNYAEALPAMERALQIRRKVLGPRHPDVVTNLNGLGVVYLQMQDNAKAREIFEQAMVIGDEVLPPNAMERARVRLNLGYALTNERRYEDALARFKEARAMFERTLGPESPEVALALEGMGDVWRYRDADRRMRGDTTRGSLPCDEARRLYTEVLAIREKVLGPEHPEVAGAHLDLGLAWYCHDAHRSVTEYEKALAIQEKLYGKGSPLTAFALTRLGEAYLEIDQPVKALAPLEKARELQDEAETNIDSRASLAYDLGRAYYLTGKDKVQGVALVKKALELRLAQKPLKDPSLWEVKDWLAKLARDPERPGRR